MLIQKLIFQREFCSIEITFIYFHKVTLGSNSLTLFKITSPFGGNISRSLAMLSGSVLLLTFAIFLTISAAFLLNPFVTSHLIDSGTNLGTKGLIENS